jgi:protein O-GlcNAc transferase
VPLAVKPAPVVIAFHAIGSTGLPTVDHWVTDELLHPVDTREEFTESLLRLPCFYLHRPPDGSPDPGPPPSAAAGRVTFGSFNNPAKVTPDVVALWARVLSSVPGSRLLLRNGRRFGDPRVIDRFRALFAGQGIAADRLLFEGHQLPRNGHLAGFDQVDISLDPFPFNGSTTTFESLWMGVPVVTLTGDRFVGRVGLDVLSRVGLADLAVADGDAYVAAAVALAADLPRRTALRRDLRSTVLASPLCDAPAYARAFEAAVRNAWGQWCGSP